MELINTHTHTFLSGHGEGTVAEVVSAAVQEGLSTLAITEHYPLSKAFDPNNKVSMPFDSLDNYCNDIRAAQAVHPELEVLLGCELDWLGDDEDRQLSNASFTRFDIVLGSVHLIDGWAFDAPSSHEGWKKRGADYVWKRYFDIWCEAVLSDKPFTVMSHPDLPKKFGYYPSFSLDDLYSQAAEAIRNSGRMVEVNTSGANLACKEMYPAKALLREFFKAGIPCTVGTDAHHPKNVATGIKQAYALMYECGYREVTVPTRDGDRRKVTIG